MLGLIAAEVCRATGRPAVGRLRQVCRAWLDIDYHATAAAFPLLLQEKIARAPVGFLADPEGARALGLLNAQSLGYRHKTFLKAVECLNLGFLAAAASILSPAVRDGPDRNGPDRNEPDRKSLIVDAAMQGHADLLKIFRNHYGFAPAEARGSNNEALRWAVIGGHLEVLRVLARVYGLEAADARVLQNEALESAAAFGSPELLAVLVAEFSLTPADARMVLRRRPRVRTRLEKVFGAL